MRDGRIAPKQNAQDIDRSLQRRHDFLQERGLDLEKLQLTLPPLSHFALVALSTADVGLARASFASPSPPSADIPPAHSHDLFKVLLMPQSRQAQKRSA